MKHESHYGAFCASAIVTIILLISQSAFAILHHGSSSPTVYEGFVASRARLFNNNNTTNKQLMCRTAHVASENLTSVKLVAQNFFTQGANLGASSTETWAIEYNGSSTRVTFSGADTVTIPDNSTATSDYISVSIPSGATFWTRSYYTNTNGILYNAWKSSILSESCAYAVSGLKDETAATGAVTGGTSAAFSHPPLAIVGHTIKPSVLIVGDSRATNVNCAGSIETDCDGKQGNIAASMGSVPFVDIANFGEKANGYKGGPRSAIFGYGSQAVVSLGINDLNCGIGGSCPSADPRNPANGHTPSQISTAIGIIFSQMSAPKKYAVAVEPRTSSSDGWLTTANQSNASVWVPNRIAYNTLVREVGVTAQTGFYDLAKIAESSLNSGLWFVSPSPPYATDGLHGNNAYQTFLKNSGAVVPAN